MIAEVKKAWDDGPQGMRHGGGGCRHGGGNGISTARSYDGRYESDIRVARWRRGAKAVVGGGLGAVIVVGVARAFGAMMKRHNALKRELQGMQDDLKNTTKKYESLVVELRDTKHALEDLNVALMEKEIHMKDLVSDLEEKAQTLKEQERSLEALKGELGLSKSTVSMVERELKATKRLLASYQGQADQARVLHESNRENVATPGSLGIASLWV